MIKYLLLIYPEKSLKIQVLLIYKLQKRKLKMNKKNKNKKNNNKKILNNKLKNLKICLISNKFIFKILLIIFIYSWTGRGSRLDENVRIKIADLGNACWYNHHFATEI